MSAANPYRARQTPDRWLIERELPCINGLSAWSAICSTVDPSAEEIGYTDGACGSAEERARLIASALNGVDQGTTWNQSRIHEVIDEGDGFWEACSGCQEGVDGYVSSKDYPYSRAFRCQPGGGCTECGGLGVLWDTTDYDAMAASMLADMREADSATSRLSRDAPLTLADIRHGLRLIEQEECDEVAASHYARRALAYLAQRDGEP